MADLHSLRASSKVSGLISLMNAVVTTGAEDSTMARPGSGPVPSGVLPIQQAAATAQPELRKRAPPKVSLPVSCLCCTYLCFTSVATCCWRGTPQA